MPPKKAAAVLKEKKKVIEDKTFGMKNKNKSKTVQKKIKGIATAVMGDPRKLAAEEAAKEQRRLQKLAEKEREKELKNLFNTIPSTEQQQKEKEEAEAAAAAAEQQEEKTEEQQEEEALTMLAQIEEEMKEEEEMTLEEIIDKERAKIVNGTPVTMETFKQWKEFRLKQQQKENELLRAQQEEVWKKSGSGITGRLLFEVDRSVFVDDEDAEAAVERVEMDDSLFLDEETANLETLDINDEASAEASSSGEASSSSKGEEYDPATWKESQPPKSLLQEFLTRRKVKELPKYESLPVTGTGAMCKIVLTHAGNKEFVNTQIYNNKKLAENNVALMALRYLQSQEPAEQTQ